MVKSLDPNQLQKIDRHYGKPIYLVHLLLDGLTLYFSDRNYSYNSHNYEDYLFDLSDIGSQIANLGGYDNGQVTLTFRNDRIRDKNYLIELFDEYSPEKKYIEIYKLLVDSGEVFGSDVSTKFFKGEMGQPYEITELGFKIDCSLMLFGKNASLPLDVIDRADFPSADPDDIGKYRNILYGSIKKVICPWTFAGWATTLVEDIDSSTTTIEVSVVDAMPATPFTAKCDNEEIRVTDNSGVYLTVTREYNGTTGTAHSKGAYFYQKIALFHAEVAQHPVKSIGDVFVERKGEWVRIKTGATKYINSGGRAYVTLDPASISFEEKISITVETTVISEGSHGHVVPAGGYSQKECIPDGSSGPTGHENVIDGNPASYCGLAQDVGVQARFDAEADLGTINKVLIYVHKLDTNSTGYVQSPSGTNLQTLPAPAGLYRIVKTSGMLWTNTVVIIGGVGGNQIAEIYKCVEYTPYDLEATAHAATGIDVDSTLSGNSVANLLIGDRVACDIEGYADPDGNYGGIGTLIERPDWIRKHILVALLGISASDIDTAISFANAGSIYASKISGGYKLAFNLPEIATEAMELFKAIDLCTRSTMFEASGKFKLVFKDLYGSSPQITFTQHNVKGIPKFSKTEVADIRNRLRGHYFRDYSKSGSLGEKYREVNEVYDSPSISKYGDQAQDLELGCIGDLSLMVDSILEWLLDQKKELRKIVQFSAFWDADILGNCDSFIMNSNFWSGNKFGVMRLVPMPKSEEIDIKGLQDCLMTSLPLDFRPYDLFIRDEYCYVCGVSYHDSKYWPKLAKIQLGASYFIPIDSAEHDSGEMGDQTGYYGIYVDADHNVYVCGRKGPAGDYAAVARKVSGSDLSSILWTSTKEPTADDDHVFLDILKEGSYIYVAGYRYKTGYSGLLYKLADSDGAESWGITDIATKCLGLGGLYDSHLWIFGENNTVRTLWKREDADGSSDTVYTFDSDSKENFKKGFSDSNYWYIAGKYTDGSNYKYGSSCRISKAGVSKDNEVLRNTVAGTTQEYSNKIVGDGSDGYVIGEFFDFTYETYHTVIDKRPVAGATSTWEVTHEQPYRNQGAIGLYLDHVYIGIYNPNLWIGYLERRKKSDGQLA